ncbi:hypothetical protein XVE_1252 [Xanthomonas vesicatoria ATCC 35937]|uniref:Uncharacterized protein n=1 Tax=Xanthomonas vesicatoria ATCC 35937 TaxID=925775 RepID=F0BAY5_9XANT|nr:hypothetical protein XVE_1252 [Xanthomonas vesicatoria ATCC 35937]
MLGAAKATPAQLGVDDLATARGGRQLGALP